MELKKYTKSITSQWGEDGIVAQIFKRIGTGNKLAVEIGSWDGKHLSNIWDLWHNQGWEAVLVERDTQRHKASSRQYTTFKKVHFINATVEPSGKSSAGGILKRITPNKRVDIMSIDIDGDDYYILESLKNNLPRVVIVEYNPSIPPHLDVVQKKGEYFGSSAKALQRLAHKKGYKVAFVTKTNLILVINEDFKKLKIQEVEINLDNFPNELITYIISSYSGVPIMVGTPPYVAPRRQSDVADDKKYQSKTPKLASHNIDKMLSVKIYTK